MDLSDLHIFRTVVREGGITRAAGALHRVQSNVTTRVRQLEEDLGIDLFLREGKRLQPTAAGRVLLDYADRLLHLADEARAAVTAGTPRGRLRLGSMESTAAARLPGPLAGFHATYPEVELELRTGPTGRLLAEVADGRLDCALVSAPVPDTRFEVTPIFTEELVLIGPAGHPPIRSAGDIKHRTLLAFEAGCAYRLCLESWLAAGGLVPERIVELSSYHAMIGCAAAGMGIALAPLSLLGTLNTAAVSVHRLEADFAASTTVLVRRRQQPSPAADALCAVLLAEREALAVADSPII